MLIDYRSIADMNDAIIRNIYRLPKDIDLVVGIPRSGMLPANLVALYINKPFTDIDSFIDGRIYNAGERGSGFRDSLIRRVLILDDSLYTGSALSKAKTKLNDVISSGKYTIFYGAVYVIEKNKGLLDFYCETTYDYRIFQWNIFQHPYFLPKSLLDIDGVLCPNPPCDDDGEKYLDYICNAPVLFKPTYEVDSLVSCRLEKYRTATEDWLKKNGIKYKKLVLLDMPDKLTRMNWGKHGEYKGKIYKDSPAVLFVESSLHEAKDIVRIAKKPVFCIETMSMMNYRENFVIRVLKLIFRKVEFYMHKK